MLLFCWPTVFSRFQHLRKICSGSEQRRHTYSIIYLCYSRDGMKMSALTIPKSVTTSAPAMSSSSRLGQWEPISCRNMLLGIFLLRVSCVKQDPLPVKYWNNKKKLLLSSIDHPPITEFKVELYVSSFGMINFSNLLHRSPTIFHKMRANSFISSLSNQSRFFEKSSILTSSFRTSSNS